MPKTKIVQQNTCMRLSEVKDFAWSPPKKFLSSYFDTFQPLNSNRSEIKAFLKVTLVSLTLRLRTVF